MIKMAGAKKNSFEDFSLDDVRACLIWCEIWGHLLGVIVSHINRNRVMLNGFREISESFYQGLTRHPQLSSVYEDRSKIFKDNWNSEVRIRLIFTVEDLEFKHWQPLRCAKKTFLRSKAFWTAFKMFSPPPLYLQGL